MQHDLIAARRLAWFVYELIGGRLSPIAAARRVPEILEFLGFDPSDPDCAAFMALDSATDGLPLGAERVGRDPEDLRDSDIQIVRYERGALARSAIEAARSLRRRLLLPHWMGPAQPRLIMIARESYTVTGRGVAVFGEARASPPTRWAHFPIQLRDPYGIGDLRVAAQEAALLSASPVREELALVVRGASVTDVPPGTRLERLAVPWSSWSLTRAV